MRTGSPYYFPHWTRGSVLLTTGAVPNPWLKYDLSTHKLLWRRAPNDSLMLDTSQITEFTLGGDKGKPAVTFRRYLSARIQQLELRTAFFEVLYDTKHSSLLRRSSRILMGSHSGPSLSGHTGGHWLNEDMYFIRRSDNLIEPVRLNKKAVLRALGETPALVAFVERERLDLRKEEAIIQLLQYYDTQ